MASNNINLPPLRDGVEESAGKRLGSIREILMRSTKTNGECIEWVCGRDWDGYGIGYYRKKTWRMNRLSYFLFVGDPTGRMVLHSCDNPPCINPSHLFLGDALANIEDARRKGRMLGPRGELNGQAKLTAAQIIEIRSRYIPRKAGSHMYDLAREFGISATQIHAIIHRDKWRSL